MSITDDQLERYAPISIIATELLAARATIKQLLSKIEQLESKLKNSRSGV